MKKKSTRPAKTATPAAAGSNSPKRRRAASKAEEPPASPSKAKSKRKAAGKAKGATASESKAAGKAEGVISAKPVAAARKPGGAAKAKPTAKRKVTAPPDKAVLPKSGTKTPAPKPIQQALSQPKPKVRIRNAVLDKITAEYLEQQIKETQPSAEPTAAPKKTRSPSKAKTKVSAPEPASAPKTPPPTLPPPPVAAKPVAQVPKPKAPSPKPRVRKVSPPPLRPQPKALETAGKAPTAASPAPAKPVVVPPAKPATLKAPPAPPEPARKVSPAARMHPVARPKAPVPRAVLKKLRTESPAKPVAPAPQKARVAKMPAPLPPKGPAARRLAARAATGRRSRTVQPAVQGATENIAATVTAAVEVQSPLRVSAPRPQGPAVARETPKKAANIPAYLLEGDELTPLPDHLRSKARPAIVSSPEPAAASVAAPAVAPPGPVAAEKKAAEHLTVRPELVLTARDPHCLYALWEMDEQQLQSWVQQAADGRLVLRVFREHASAQPLTEIHLHPGERHSFCHVRDENTRYIAVLGYYRWDRSWQEIARSGEAVTPPKAPSVSRTIEFAKHDVPATPAAAVPPGTAAAAPGNPPWLAAAPVPDAPLSIYTAPGTDAPESWAHTAPEPSGRVLPAAQPRVADEESLLAPEREHQILELLRTFSIVTTPADSLVISESVQERALQKEVSRRAPVSAMPAPVSSFSLPLGLPPEEETALPVEVSSVQHAPAGAVSVPDFWFKVNAEVVVYGSTVPSARVTIGNRPIRLRPDGTFTFRFSLPDGQHTLPIVAKATHGDERAAKLQFTRCTELTGSVGVHPQDPTLKPPSPDNVS